MVCAAGRRPHRAHRGGGCHPQNVFWGTRACDPMPAQWAHTSPHARARRTRTRAHAHPPAHPHPDTPYHPRLVFHRVRGGVTGVGQQVGCLARIFSPTLSAKLFAWGAGSTLPFPLDHHVAFVAFGALWGLPLLLNLQLTDADVARREVPPRARVG